ncbi:type VI secretion system baseplate subunit TssG [Stieleria sp. ICT_E10.1]|uniref:type VI secretion system baseplate subunit TssG n=1 Tax=Stieleria sedimenti TaxID=2976331 RepID=UPI00217FA4B3|nr:type VI secretion system baseplate subunit TssG [Stieleria sedimenti]MCS7466682.1 type VI secretion system baseplate subunit TssG [Stieleria sedimenti]
MAGAIRKTDVSVSKRLVDEPYQFSFFQAVRLLLSGALAELDRDLALGSNARRGRLGTVSNISEEGVRFRSEVSLSFSPSEIVSLHPRQRKSDAEDDSDNQPWELEIAFWGLIGPAGALPNHYTQLVIDRVHNKDVAMRDFLDIFSHRQLSFFYRAWEKYFLPAGFENAVNDQRPENDLVREALLAIVGRGTKHVRNRLESADDACVYYGGQFVDRPTAESLRAMVSDYLQLPAAVLSLFGQWLVLPIAERSRLGRADGHCRMGVDTIMGDRTWDPSSKFRIQIGPVTWQQFESLMPTGETLVRICQFIRSYVGLEFDFDLQVILSADEIPVCELPSESSFTGPGESTKVKPHLGWNTWLCSKPPTRDSDDAVFHHDGAPTR